MVLYFFASVTGTQADALDALQGLGQPKYHSLESALNHNAYHLYVRLPANYNNETQYPTLYLLDGGISYPLISAYYHYLRFTDELPPMIIVGISYGTDDWKKGNARSRDYTATSTEREHWGGADKFQSVLKGEILPLVEDLYPSDPAKRLIFGNSLAGQFVLYTAMTQPSLFSGHIASNPALHRNLPFFLDENNLAPDVGPQAKLFVSSGSEDHAQFREPAVQWMEVWAAKNKGFWTLQTQTLQNEGHMSAIPTAFVHGARWILDSH